MQYTVEQLESNSFRIHSPMGVYMDLIVGRDKALLLDTGYGLGDLRSVVRSITDLPLYVVNTHGHVDHTCGNYQFDQPIYIHEMDIDVCRLHTSRLYRVLSLELANSMGLAENISEGGPDYAEVNKYLSSGAGELVPVKEGYVFDLGGVHLSVIELPGHTMGSIGLLYEERNTLYVGDAVNEFLWLFLPEASSLDTYFQTLQKVKNLRPDKLVLSHRDGYVDPNELDGYIEVAQDISYEDGTPFTALLAPGATAKICCRRGFTPEDMGKPGFASIVINKDHI